MNRALLACFLFTLVLSCETSEEKIVQLLKQRYSHLEIKNPKKIQKVFDDLEIYFKKNQLNQKSLNNINVILNQIEDGHIYVASSRAEVRKQSLIEFYPGTEFIKSCNKCNPTIKNGKYQLVAVNNSELETWLTLNKYQVSASTDQGRRYRLIRSLSDSVLTNIKTIKVKNKVGKIIESNLHWEEALRMTDPCISGERINEQIFLLKVNNFWCDIGKGGSSRELILQNFKDQFDATAKHIKNSDRIILDLRNNSGGADLEVEFLLNSFFNRSINLYSYQYLLINAPGPLKKIIEYLPWDMHLWDKKLEEYTVIKNSSLIHLYDNKLDVMISAGCFSSCEVVAEAIKVEKRGLLWGTITHGAAGDPVLFSIGNSGLVINIPTGLGWKKNGELFEGVGVAPNINHISSLSIEGDELLFKVVNDKN
jgi:hypothetical protein